MKQSRTDNEELRAKVELSALKYGVMNKNQIFPLVGNLFEYDSTTGEHVHFVKDKNGKIVATKTIDEAVKEFLDDPENENLVQSTVKRGTGTGHIGGLGSSSGTGRRERKKYPREVIEKANEKGLHPDDYVKIEEKRKQALGK